MSENTNISEGIKEYDDRGNLTYWKTFNGYIYEEWREYDENDNKIYCNENGTEFWFKYDEIGRKWRITKKEFEKIKSEREEREFLSREPIPRFEIMEL